MNPQRDNNNKKVDNSNVNTTNSNANNSNLINSNATNSKMKNSNLINSNANNSKMKSSNLINSNATNSNINSNININNSRSDIYEQYMSDEEILADLICYIEYLVLSNLRLANIKSGEAEGTKGLGHLIEEVQQETARVECFMKKKIELSIRNNIDLRFITLFNILKSSRLERFMVVLAITFEMSENIRNMVPMAENNEHSIMPTKELGVKLFGLLESIAFEEIANIISGNGMIDLCLQSDKEVEVEIWASQGIHIQKPLLSWLLGNSFDQSYEFERKDNNLPPLLLYETILEKAEHIAKQQQEWKKNIVLYLYGEKNAGKKHMVAHLAKNINRKVLYLSWDRIQLWEDHLKRKKLKEIELYCLLENAFICLVDLPMEMERNQSDSRIVYHVWEQLQRISPFIIAIGEHKNDISDEKIDRFVSFEFPIPTAIEKQTVWNYYKEQFKAKEEIDAQMNGNKYILNTGGIKHIFEMADTIATVNGSASIGNDEITKALMMCDKGLSSATFIKSNFVFEDLVIEEDVKRQMHHICNHIKYKNVVGDTWGFFDKTPYGRGASVLFYGPPGTGKTMAAQVMANYLSLDLYRIDLSKMISKYIGETEKNISELFKQAKHMNVILFFDEADSLFSKRTSGKDANDRNANSETAHLLQKLEEYEGISILATNLVDQIDDAFRRRIKFMIPFRFPDMQTRKVLWETLLPKKAPKEEDLDLDFFANEFELSGSQIKEILLNAAYIAASEGKNMGNNQIKEALILNYQKYGKRLTKEDFLYLR